MPQMKPMSWVLIMILMIFSAFFCGLNLNYVWINDLELVFNSVESANLSNKFIEW